MLKETEEELKYLVSPEQFQMLLSKCNAKYHLAKEEVQVNYYYDTEDCVFNKAKTTVRIRQQNERLKLQIKKHNNNDSLAISDEYTQIVDELPCVLIMPNTQSNLSLIGSLVTVRRLFVLDEKITICFDRNMYLGICDYEIEIEVNTAAKFEVLAVLNYLGLKHTPIISKSERFFMRLGIMSAKSCNSFHIESI